MYTPSASHKVGSDGLNLSTAGRPLAGSGSPGHLQSCFALLTEHLSLQKKHHKSDSGRFSFSISCTAPRPRTSLIQQPDPDSNKGSQNGKRRAHERAPQEAPITFFNQPPASSMQFPSNPRHLTLKRRVSKPPATSDPVRSHFCRQLTALVTIRLTFRGELLPPVKGAES